MCFYSRLKLQLSDVSLTVEQRSSMKAIYIGHNVFAWLSTGYGKSLLSSPTFFHGFQERSVLSIADFQLCSTNFVSFIIALGRELWSLLLVCVIKEVPLEDWPTKITCIHVSFRFFMKISVPLTVEL